MIRWADLESSGRLAEMQETQLQGQFLREVFGDALGYARFVEGGASWQVAQHWAIPGNGTPDAILGRFTSGQARIPQVVIELKGPAFHLDRQRVAGRLPEQQLWDYFAFLPNCRWGIVSNYVSFRLYERDSTPRRYQHFSLEGLRNLEEFKRFYALFGRNGLLGTPAAPATILGLLDETQRRQKTVGDELYERYRTERRRLLAYLHYEREFPIDKAIEIAQRLIDRIIFIAFCEDRGLLRYHDTLERTWRDVGAIRLVTNPRWQNFVGLFRGIDRGNDEFLGLTQGYNGGLFEPSEADELDLDDDWTNFFKEVGGYGFGDEVNLEVLGHLFERSIAELDRLRQGDFFVRTSELTAAPNIRERPTMPQSAERKRLGIYYTPPALTERIVVLAVGELIRERFAAVAARLGLDPERADSLDYWCQCLDILRRLKICDPACGSGAFLFQAYTLLESRYGEVINALHLFEHPDAADLEEDIPDMILEENLYGVDLSREAVEITQLALWIRSARYDRKLSDLSHHIHWGNSLVRDPSVHPKAFDWRAAFPEVFDRPEAGFDCVIGNPPWERMNLEEREFFSISAPEIATASNAARRREMIERLPATNRELHEKYVQALDTTQKQLDYARRSGEYPLTGRGDINTYVVFAELASKIVAPLGRVGLLVPSGIATDSTTQDFFAMLTDSQRLIALYDFENRHGLFPDVHRSFKFSILVFSGEQCGQHEADFIFFAHDVAEIDNPRKHIALTAADIRLLNPNTRTCPIFRSRRDAEITKRIYTNVPVLIDRTRERGGNPWGIRFRQGLFNQTSDSELFKEAPWFLRNQYTLRRNQWKKNRTVYWPVYEAKMVQMYDHRAAGVITDEGNWVRQGQTAAMSLADHQNPERVPVPRFWVEPRHVEAQFPEGLPPAFLAFKDVTSPTNQRTMIAAYVPPVGVVNSAPLIFSDANARLQCCLLANLNSLAYDFVVRQKVGNVHLNFFIVEQAATLSPEHYRDRCPWDRRITLERWISERVLKLTCTAEDMQPLAEACEFTGGDLEGYDGRLHRWNPEERADLVADLDAAFFHLYRIDREDAEYILGTFSGFDDSEPALPPHRSPMDRVLDTYDRLAASSAG